MPGAVLTQLLVENVTSVAGEVRAGRLAIPPPPASVKDWALIGELVARVWGIAATNLGDALRLVEPQIKALGAWLVNVAAAAGMGLLMLVFAFVIAGVFLAHADSSHRLAQRIAVRLAGDRGEEYADLAEATIRSVA